MTTTVTELSCLNYGVHSIAITCHIVIFPVGVLYVAGTEFCAKKPNLAMRSNFSLDGHYAEFGLF